MTIAHAEVVWSLRQLGLVGRTPNRELEFNRSANRSDPYPCFPSGSVDSTTLGVVDFMELAREKLVDGELVYELYCPRCEKYSPTVWVYCMHCENAFTLKAFQELMNGLGGPGRDLSYRERVARETYGVRLPWPRNQSRGGARVDPEAIQFKQRLVRRCRNFQFRGHADRYDHDLRYRSYCLEKDTPRVLVQAVPKSNKVVVIEAGYFISTNTPEENLWFAEVVDRTLNKDWKEVAESWWRKKYSLLSSWDESLMNKTKVLFGDES